MKSLLLPVVAITLISFSLGGCADIKSKFIRQKPDDGLPRTYIPVREYDVRPNMELYARRYIFWRNWHKEFMDLIQDPRETNQKKFIMALDQTYSNLYDMRKMLEDDAGDELQTLMDGVREARDSVRRDRLTHGNRVRIMRHMDILGREIRDRFSAANVAGRLRDDFRED